MTFNRYRNSTYKSINMRLLLRLMMALLLVSITACSTKLAYNNLDWIASWYVDDYVTLTSAQEKQLDSSIESLLLWHRKTELQNYVVQIKYIKIDLKNGIKHSTIKNYINALKQFWDVILLKAEPDVMRFANSLSDKQVTELLAEIEQQNLKKINDFDNSSERERLKKRFERIEEQITEFTGPLDTQQKKRLTQLNASLLSAFEQRIQFRRDWAKSIAAAYQLRQQKHHKENDRVQFEQALRPALINTNSLRSQEYLAIFEHNQAQWVEFLAQLISSLNVKQLSNVQSKLDDTIADIQGLY